MLFVGQLAVVAWFVFRQEGPFDLADAIRVVGGGLTISLSVIMGLPAALGAIWLATASVAHAVCRISRAALAVVAPARDRHRRAGRAGRKLGPAVARAGAGGRARLHGRRAEIGAADGAVWLLVIAFCVAAPVSEEFFARGFLYRGWSESFLKVPGAILLSSLVWTGLHLQYDWFFFGQVFSIGLLFGWLRYRSNSTWLTVVLHGLNNFAATLQSIWLAGSAPV